ALIYPKFASIGTDGVFYALMAKSLAEGGGLSVFHHAMVYFSPLLSVVIVPFYWLIGNIDVAAHITVIVLGLLSLPFFYYALRSFVERRVAAVATLFLAVNATVVWRNLRPVAQPLAAFLSVVLFFLLTKYIEIDKQRPKVFVLSFLLGLVAGALYLTRPEYIVLIVPLSLFLFWVNCSSVALKRNLLIVLAAVFGFILCATPYIIFLHNETGQWTFTGRLSVQILAAQGQSLSSSGSVIVSTVPQGNPAMVFLDNIVDRKFLKIYFSNLYDIERILLRTFGVIGFAFFGIGLLKVFREKRYAVLGALAVPASVLFGLAIGHTGENGYIAPYLFLFIALIGVGCYEVIVEIFNVFASAQWKRSLSAVVVVVMSMTYFAFPLFQNLLFRPAETAKPVEYQLLGSWFHRNVENPQNQVIAARKPEIAFHADADWMEISGKETPSEILQMMNANGATYLAIDTRSLGKDAERLVDKDGKFSEKRLEFVYRIDYFDQHVYLYRLTQ
ncbi:MAG: glycosyltransferase family 39 protein, partial [Candidatus Uhrbacteria bacterium]|nr:glycosyltransferase family 39 protein [Candidatus Uhrbacteria bacterium]